MVYDITSGGGGTSTNAQWSPGTTARQTLTKDGLTPGTSYVLVIQAIKNNADGTKSISDYASIPYTASAKGASGLNQLSMNNGTDIQLNGGAIYATNTSNPFPPNVGVFDVVNGTTTGTGVIMNSSGLAAFNSGTKQFYIDASNGNAYFSGTIQATIIKSTGYSSSDPTDGSAYSSNGMAINLNNGSITSKNFRISSDGSAYFKGDVSASTIGGQSLVSYVGSTATTAAQTAANGKNKVYYSVGTSATSSRAPDNVVYDTTFPSYVASGQSNIAGDTWFSYNSSYRIIAQYTGQGGTAWQQTKVDGLTIANIDAGSITTGTLSASISINGPTITGSNYYSASSGKRISISNSNNAIQFSNTSGTITGNITSIVGGTYDGVIINGGTSPDTNFTGSNAAIAIGSFAIDLYVNPGTFGSAYISVNSANISINGGDTQVTLTGGASGGVVISKLKTQSSMPLGILMTSQADNGLSAQFNSRGGTVYTASITVASDPGTTPSSSVPGDMWLYY
jgi:hypothetical protein